ncbi:YaiI/YqxD family protein [Myxococcota bacterium]|nr:YaiI/YqxD family protein [Myxococcota bacterium]MBU1430054.1 YaiI/YqxD family protein [Myxococcota bacterium]MBU1896422.1 YaiI/YqxD family protein [Myxococcota bacterium]
MKIWVDADGCPRAVKEVVFKAAERREVETVLVANHAISTPQSRWISAIIVASGMDVADDWIEARVAEADLVITADIPLAARVVARGATGLDPRGDEYTEDNVRERLSMRDFMHSLREAMPLGLEPKRASGGGALGGGPPYGPKDKQRFANALDRLLTRAAR